MIEKEQKLKSYPCNMCGEKDSKTISRRDRYGFKVQTVICKKCALIFINPRMDKESYDIFYQQSYRPLLEKYKGKQGSHQKNWDKSFNLGIELAKKFSPSLKEGKTVEVGSSTGGVLAGLKYFRKDLDVLGLEPSLEESDFARAKGIQTFTGLFENAGPDLFSGCSNIVIVRSLNHLLDPRYFFEWCHKSLDDSGVLLIMVLDFLNFCEKRSKVLTQIDHPFMFSRASLKNFLGNVGFNVIHEDLNQPDYIKLVAKKNPKPLPLEHNFDPKNYSSSLARLNYFRLNFNFWKKFLFQK